MTPAQISEVNEIASAAFARLRRRIAGKSELSGFDDLLKAITSAYECGLGHALDSEGRAWARVAELEDLLIAILRWAPAGDLAAAKGAVANVSSLFDKEEQS